MNPKRDFKEYFEKVLGTKIEIQGKSVNSKDQERYCFISFIDNYRKAIQRTILLQNEHDINFYSWDSLFAESIESLINFTFDKELSKLILWFIYKHPFVEKEEEKIITDPNGNPHLIETSEDLYELILLLESL
jgi:hypothetical protein